MTKTLQDQVRSLSKKLQLLCRCSGFFEAGTTECARAFYEAWQAINTACLEAGYEDGRGDISFVSGQLKLILGNFPANKTTVGVLEVFQLTFSTSGMYIDSGMLFGDYIVKLDKIASSSQAIPA